MVNTETRQTGDIYGPGPIVHDFEQDFEPMVGRGNFPGHNVLCVSAGNGQESMNSYWYLCIWMGALGRMVTAGREKKQHEKSPKWQNITCFVVYARDKKKTGR